MPCFDEFLEEIVISFWVWEEGIALGDGEGKGGEERVEELIEYSGWLLGMDAGGVGGQEAEKGEECLPEEGPVVGEAGLRADKMDEYTMEEGEGGDVEWKGEADAEVVCQGIGADVEDCFYGRTGLWCWREERRDLSAESHSRRRWRV